MRLINEIVIHCSATAEGKHYSVDTIRDWHVKKRGWSDIGYHYVIYLDGTVVEGRPVRRAGAHVKGRNKNSIGICYIGGVESKRRNGKWIAKDTRTVEQKKALDCLLDELITEYNLTYQDIYGHNEFANKSCPCFDVKKEYRNGRKR